jgi:hypothetical protein
MFASAANLATHINAIGSTHVAYLGMMVAFATMLSLFMLFMPDGLNSVRMLLLGFGSICFFPLLIGLLVGCILIASGSTLPWKWAATSVFGVSVLFVIIDQLAIPPALTLLMQSEQLTFRSVGTATPPQISVVAVVWPLLTIFSALLIDLVLQRAKKQSWSKRQLLLGLVLATFVCTIPCIIEEPQVVIDMISSTGVVGAILSYAIGFLGILVGIKLAQSIEKTLQTLEG